MRVTTKLPLPPPLLKALTSDNYQRGDADITITELIGAPHQRKLISKHWDSLVEEAGDRVWSLFGQAIHTILERAASQEYVVEKRLGWTVDDWLVSGQIDVYEPAFKRLSDYKVTSVWSVKDYSFKPEWELQANCYTWLLAQNGNEVKELQVVALLKDWSRGELRRRGEGYPEHPIAIRRIPIWTEEESYNYIRDRILLHKMQKPPICSPEERWDKPTTWAVKSKTRKTAKRVLHNKIDAEKWMTSNGKAGDYIEERPGESVRCESYCPVKEHCEYGSKLG